MSACPSSPITLLAACGDTAPDLADAAVESAAGHVGEDLLVVLAAVSDPRKSRGVRHRLLTVLAAAVCAVLAGARSYVAIAEWAADLPISVRLRLGMGHRAPSESTLPRVLQRVDADELDTAVSAWPARRVADPSPADAAAGTGPVRAIALDGKTTRGARVRNGRAVHLLGVLDHTTGVVPGQTEVDATTNEITAFTPLLQRIDTACPLHGAVITADALHTQDRHARWLHDHGAHYVFIIKANRATLPAQLAELPCRDVPVVDQTRGRGHGRVETRTLQLTAVAAGIEFPHAGLAARTLRRRRTISSAKKWSTETVYAITSLGIPDTPRRPSRRDHPRALARGEPTALGARRDLRRGPVPDPYRHRPSSDGRAAQPRDQPSPPRRSHQHRHRLPRHRPTPHASR